VHFFEVSSTPTPHGHYMEEESICYHEEEPSLQFYGQSYSFLSHSEANMQLLEYISKLEAHQEEESSPINWS
jgi:hypothetical protein